MIKNLLRILVFGFFAIAFCQICHAKQRGDDTPIISCARQVTLKDTIPAEIMDIVSSVVYSLNSFNIEKVADLYTPNAVVADDEPPYSWNGPTAGVQWVNAVESVCRANRLTRLKGTMANINVYQQSTDNVYMVVPVDYTGDLPGNVSFNAKGAFAFVLRMINGKWLIKSQVWLPQKAM